MKTTHSFLLVSALAFSTCVSAYAAGIVPDNGGTADLPIQLTYCNTNENLQIIDGLPPGTSVQVGVELTAPLSTFEQVGGTLGGTQSTAIGPDFYWYMYGTGALSGYVRYLSMPLSDVTSFASPLGSTFEVHAAPRTAGDPVQSFATDMFRLFGQVTGDPDFDLLRITAGTDFGLPSPGHTTLSQLPGGNWAVDSFFDITYRIDFVGAPGSVLQGQSGSTTGTVRLEAQGIPEPSVIALLAVGGFALVFPTTHRGRREAQRLGNR